jgi:hypothetical protein
MKNLFKNKQGATLSYIALLIALYIGIYTTKRMSGRIAVLPPGIWGNSEHHHVFGVANEEFGPGRENRRITCLFLPLCKTEGAILDVIRKK